MPRAAPARPFDLPAGRFRARDLVDGVLIDPVLPRNFDSTPNESRPVTQRKWWRLPFIVTDSVAALDAYFAERTDEYAEKCRTEWTANGRPQWLAGKYRAAALRRAAVGLGARVAGASCQLLLGELAVRWLDDEDGVSADIDTAADLDRARAAYREGDR